MKAAQWLRIIVRGFRLSRLVNAWCWGPAALLVLSGCATPLTSGVGGAAALEFKTSERDGTLFRAVERNRVVSTGMARGGSVVFPLPATGDVGPCIAIFDAKGKNILPDGGAVYAAVRTELVSVTGSLQRTQAELAASRSNDPRLLLEGARQRLSANRAFDGRQCSRPEQRPVPRRPLTRCTDRNECTQDGAAICFTRYMGEKGCGAAFSQFRIPGILSGPGCGAAAARLAGDKYEMGDAVVDANLGAIEDAGASLRRSDGLGDQLLGTLIALGSEAAKLAQARSCTDSFVQRHFGPLEAWQSDVRDITAEPDRLLATCRADHAGLSSLESAVRTSPVPAQTDLLAARVAELEARVRALRSERRPLASFKRA